MLSTLRRSRGDPQWKKEMERPNGLAHYPLSSPFPRHHPTLRSIGLCLYRFRDRSYGLDVWLHALTVTPARLSLVSNKRRYDIPLIYNLIRFSYAPFDGHTAFRLFYRTVSSWSHSFLMMDILFFSVYSACSSHHFPHSTKHFTANILYR